MKRITAILLSICLLAITSTGCGEQEDVSQFTDQMNVFCENVSRLDASINSISVSTDEEGYEQSKQALLSYLDELRLEFQYLAEIDFPEDFDYLEDVCTQASNYMTEAVSSYHRLYGEEYSDELEAYARENYSRAYKRVQVVITLLHGEEPSDSDLIIK